MEKFDKITRLEYYIKMLSLYDIPDKSYNPLYLYNRSGFCYICKKVGGENLSNFPELMKYKPSKFWINLGFYNIFYYKPQYYWFCLNNRGIRKRIKILKEIIKKLEKELSIS